jgi:hypothetical protein
MRLRSLVVRFFLPVENPKPTPPVRLDQAELPGGQHEQNLILIKANDRITRQIGCQRTKAWGECYGLT